jgi:outer membrane PBP1 activator LpoA protein
MGPAVLGFRNRRLEGVLILRISDSGERVETVHVIADPAKLAFLKGMLDAASTSGT